MQLLAICGHCANKNCTSTSRRNQRKLDMPALLFDNLQGTSFLVRIPSKRLICLFGVNAIEWMQFAMGTKGCHGSHPLPLNG